MRQDEPDYRSKETKGKRRSGVGPKQITADAELIAACVRGDADAWNTLIARYQGFIFGLTLRLGLSTSDAEDVFQNVCLKLYQHLGDLRDVDRLSTWLASVTQREVAQFFRKQTPNVLHQEDVDQERIDAADPIYASPALTPEEEVLAWERQYLIRQMLENLSEDCYCLLTLLYHSERPRSYIEVAEALSIPVGSIGPKRARCLEHLRKMLEKSGY